ncbi:unnamed protein product [Gordionus sp. m RMFG-2023]
MRPGSSFPQPYLKILEQPLERGFRFRYKSEAGAHGGLPAETSQRNNKKYPTIKIENYLGPARVEVTLMTNEPEPRLHVHKLVGKNCDDGSCQVRILPENEMTICFQNLGILHVPKKEVPQIMQERLEEEYRMQKIMSQDRHSANYDLSEAERQMIRVNAEENAKTMELNVIRLCFQSYIIDSSGHEIPIPPVLSKPVYDSKSPNTAALKICRMDKQAGYCVGNEEIFLLCERVQKDDISIRFFELDEKGKEIWHDYGKFSIHDVHKQYAIVFRTPPFRTQNLSKPARVFIQLQKKKDGLTSEPKPFTFRPVPLYDEHVGKKRQKFLLSMTDLEILNDALCMIENFSGNDPNFNTEADKPSNNKDKDNSLSFKPKNNAQEDEIIISDGGQTKPIIYQGEKYCKNDQLPIDSHLNRQTSNQPITQITSVDKMIDIAQTPTINTEKSNNININYHHYQQQYFYHPTFFQPHNYPPHPLADINNADDLTQLHHTSQIHSSGRYFMDECTSGNESNENGVRVPEISNNAKSSLSENNVYFQNINGKDFSVSRGDMYSKCNRKEHTNISNPLTNTVTNYPAKFNSEKIIPISRSVKRNLDMDTDKRQFATSSDMSSIDSKSLEEDQYINNYNNQSMSENNRSSVCCNSYTSEIHSPLSGKSSSTHNSHQSTNYHTHNVQNRNSSNIDDSISSNFSKKSPESKETHYYNKINQYNNKNNHSPIYTEWNHLSDNDAIDKDSLQKRLPSQNLEIFHNTNFELFASGFPNVPYSTDITVRNISGHNTSEQQATKYDNDYIPESNGQSDFVPLLRARCLEPILPSNSATNPQQIDDHSIMLTNMSNLNLIDSRNELTPPISSMSREGDISEYASSVDSGIEDNVHTLITNSRSENDESNIIQFASPILKAKISLKGNEILMGLVDYATFGDLAPFLSLFSHYIALPDVDGNTPLHHAIMNGNENVALTLLNSLNKTPSLAVNLVTFYNNIQKTPLHLASQLDMPKVVNVLTSLNSDLTLLDGQGNNPLHLCVAHNSINSLQMLISNPILKDQLEKIVNDLNYAGESPIHLASTNLNTMYLELLCNINNIQVNKMNGKSGKTPLHLAVERRCTQNIDYLVKQENINVNCKSFNDHTPLDLSYTLNSSDSIIQTLVKNGAITINRSIHEDNEIDESEDEIDE